ncbi:MAG: CDP-diacylglycerol--glycerol-3-phosphate 3-phosphatidyltransferase [Clostridiales bacterium]|nr:CDP-diacylglycerol--glycerol-3-phosphate 3-phosphatidyltransferase [Clostridiales bacterium]
MTLANKITLARIIVVPFFLFTLLAPFAYHDLWAALLFFIAAITDVLDGWIARRQNHVSNFGKVFDPIADKLIVLAALVPLTQRGAVHVLITIVLIGRELLVSGLRIVAVSANGRVISASWLGKAKTISQDTAIVLILIRDPILNAITAFPLETAALYIALIFTLWSTVDYFIRNRNALAGGRDTI